MIKESDLVKKLRQEFKKLLPGVVVLKINDKSSAGIPDLSIDHDDSHLWIETKVLRQYNTRTAFKKHIDLLQLGNCCLLERQGRCFYLILYDKDSILVVRPSTIYLALAKPNLVFDFFHDVKFLASFAGTLETATGFLCQTMKEPKR